MKIASRIAQYLLGFLFLVFGLNGFLNFIHMPPPTGLALQFAGALMLSHFMLVVSSLQLISGILLLINRYVPLALVLLGPVIVNILLFHVFMALSGLPLALFVIVLWLLVAASVRSAFTGILQPTVQN
jgi:putative oxidoreductase